MLVSKLIERLEEQMENEGDVEVLLMTQENWPFENKIHGVTSRSELDHEEDGPHEEHDNAIFITEGRQLRYGDKNAWNN